MTTTSADATDSSHRGRTSGLHSVLSLFRPDEVPSTDIRLRHLYIDADACLCIGPVPASAVQTMLGAPVPETLAHAMVQSEIPRSAGSKGHSARLCLERTSPYRLGGK